MGLPQHGIEQMHLTTSKHPFASVHVKSTCPILVNNSPLHFGEIYPILNEGS
jgi:hypothetical protein